jgi:hypothetical protein
MRVTQLIAVLVEFDSMIRGGLLLPSLSFETACVATLVPFPRLLIFNLPRVPGDAPSTFKLFAADPASVDFYWIYATYSGLGLQLL